MSKKLAPRSGKKTGGRARRKIMKHTPSGVAHVKATFNNTLVTITDPAGNVVAWCSAGSSGMQGSRKSSAYAATVAAKKAAEAAQSAGMNEIRIRLKGPGAGRESAVRGIQASGMMIVEIQDCTPVPHNGCKPRKRRRV